MIGRREGRGRVGVPIHAMSDIAFLLLIFIMLLALLNRGREAPVAYPEAESGRAVSRNQAMEIWVDRKGTLYLAGEAVGFLRLEGVVTKRIAEAPSTEIQLLADHETPFKHVERILSLLQLLEHRAVSLIVSDVGRSTQGHGVPGGTAPANSRPPQAAPSGGNE